MSNRTYKLNSFNFNSILSLPFVMLASVRSILYSKKYGGFYNNGWQIKIKHYRAKIYLSKCKNMRDFK